jgi:hypothetical protein
MKDTIKFFIPYLVVLAVLFVVVFGIVKGVDYLNRISCESFGEESGFPWKLNNNSCFVEIEPELWIRSIDFHLYARYLNESGR